MLGALFTPMTIFEEFEFVGGVGFIFFSQIILGATDSTEETYKNTGGFFCFSHDSYFIAKYGNYK